jgi:hypothetical protein
MTGYPRLVSMQVYTVGDQPLFYGYVEEDQVYCLPDKQWIAKPSYLDYFNCRELEPSDMPDVVLHDLVDPQDYDELRVLGLIEPQLEALYTKIQTLKQHIASIQGPEGGSLFGSGQGTPENMSSGIAKVLQAIQASVSNPGLVGEIRKCVEGLSEQEKDMMKLISKYFGLGEVAFDR